MHRFVDVAEIHQQNFSDNGLVIVKEDGTVIEYPRMQGTNITCVTGNTNNY